MLKHKPIMFVMMVEIATLAKAQAGRPDTMEIGEQANQLLGKQ
jgi:hypothetical protein